MSSDTQEQQSLTEYVAQFAAATRYEDIPDQVMRLGKKAILDGIGVALSGSVSGPSRIIRDYLQGLDCSGAHASVIGAKIKPAPRFAALANGTAMHADDYDDTLHAETGRYQGIHPTAPVLSATLAVAEQRGMSGRELLTAYQVGVETTCRIFDATHVDHVLHGFHPTGTCGMLGATAAVARLAGFDTGRMRVALGLAASMSGGVQQNFGTMTKPFHAGRSAECAIVTADLVDRGFTASNIILEAPRGFYRAQGGGHEEARLRGKLGNPWSFIDRGICLKPFPTGGLSHPAMTRMLELVVKHDIQPQQVARIRVRTSKNVHHTLLHHRPESELEAKFSMEFCLAALLLDRRCGLKQFNDAYVNRPEVQRALALVEYTTFDESEARAKGYDIVTSFVEIVLTDGRTIAARADHGKGNITDPMSETEVAAKFRECAEYAHWSSAKTERAIDMILHLDGLADVHELTACLSV